MAVDKIFYNQMSSKQLGWKPHWFGAEYFDEDLIKEIKKWQRNRKLKIDGLIGPMSFRRIWTEREASIDDFLPPEVPACLGSHIVCNSEIIPIEWDKVVLWSQQGGLTCNPGTYYNFAGKPKRDVKMFVNHWDVCLSSKSCEKIMKRKGTSVHFCIDNDGTIYQLLDTQHAAWQAGTRVTNLASVGVEISNAYYTKYNKTYVKRGFGERPTWVGEVHGSKLGQFLGFYDVQLEALKALWKAMNKAYSIPLSAPINENNDLLKGVHKPAAQGKYRGIVNHYNLTKRKIDCAGLDVLKLLEEIKQQ